MVESVRSSFLREAFDIVERSRGPHALERLRVRLSKATEHDGSTPSEDESPTALIALSVAEDLLLGIESALGDGSGRVLEFIGEEWVSRVLSQRVGTVIPGDAVATLRRLEVPLLGAFVDVKLVYRVERTPGGYSLTIGSPLHPRMTRVLRHLAAGAIVTVQRFCRERMSDVRVYGEIRGELAIVDAVLGSSEAPVEPAAPAPAPPRRPSRPAPRAGKSLSREVDAILSRSGLSTVPRFGSSESPTAPGTRRPRRR